MSTLWIILTAYMYNMSHFHCGFPFWTLLRKQWSIKDSADFILQRCPQTRKSHWKRIPSNPQLLVIGQRVRKRRRTWYSEEEAEEEEELFASPHIIFKHGFTFFSITSLYARIHKDQYLLLNPSPYESYSPGDTIWKPTIPSPSGSKITLNFVLVYDQIYAMW